jgi:hypothetical protein
VNRKIHQYEEELRKCSSMKPGADLGEQGEGAAVAAADEHAHHLAVAAEVQHRHARVRMLPLQGIEDSSNSVRQ